MQPGLLLGLTLLAAICGGYAARFVRVPRVVGFILAGVALRLLILFSVSPDATEAKAKLQLALGPLQVISDLALGLILFTIGSVFEQRKMRTGGKAMLKQSALEMGTVFVAVSGVCLLTLRLTDPGRDWNDSFVFAVLLGAAAIATAPAATLFVLQEYEAKGPVTDRILNLTGLNNVGCIALFFSLFFAFLAFGMLEAQASATSRPMLSLTCMTVGSVFLGIVAGAVLAMLHGKLPLAETLLFFFAFFIMLKSGEEWLLRRTGVSYNFLLTSIVSGAIFANVAIDAKRLEDALRTIGVPIFAAFFVLAGLNLHLDELTHLGWLGFAYVSARVVGKMLGCRFGHHSEVSGTSGAKIGSALLCQAAVVIGLCVFVKSQWDSPLAKRFEAVILGSVILFELIGPLLVKRVVVQAGEVKAITLLRRRGTRMEGGSIVSITVQALRRLVGWERRPDDPDDGPLLVRHIMRSNVQFLLASTTFDEVLHFIERSTYTHFTVVEEDGTYAGVIHFSDVRDVIYDPAVCELITAVDLADPDSPTAPADHTLDQLFDVFTDSNLTVLPVVEKADHDRIVGIVEQRDLLRALHRSAG